MSDAEMTNQKVRQLADNAWLLLISRAAATLAIPAILGGFAFVMTTSTTLAVHQDNLRRHEIEISSNRERITRRETDAFTAADAAAMEARFERQFDQMLAEIRALREERERERRQ